MANILTPYTPNVEANIWLNAAKKHGWEIDIVVPEKSLAYLRKGTVQYQICRGVLSANSTSSTEISQDKYFTYLVLKDAVPFLTHPTEFSVDAISDSEIQQLLDKYHKLVVKPVDTNNGIGVTTSLVSLEDVKVAIQRIKEVKSDRFLIENHVDAHEEYRIMIWKGEVIDIIHRIPAYVEGDGVSSIEFLIEKKNNERKQKYGTIFDPIVVDESLKNYLKHQSLNLTSVPLKGHKIYVRQMCNLAQGGETERISIDKIHPDYRLVFKTIYKKTWLTYCGVDLITANISEKPDPQKSVINELNGSPALSVPFFADLRENKPFYGAGQMLKKMEEDPVASM
jgi:D-alanine-D-alanine ligase-like ATP-grasp enzyme